MINILDRTKLFALRIIRLDASLPRSTEAQVIGKQGPAVRDVRGRAFTGRQTEPFEC